MSARTENEKLAAEKQAVIVRNETLEETLSKAAAVIERQERDSQELMEGMRDLQMALEVRGWKLLKGGIDQREFDGLDLDLLKQLSDELRAFFTGGALAKRLVEVRANFVVGGGGVEFAKTQGAQRAVDDLHNQQTLFGTIGLQEILRAEATDGNVVILVNPATKKLRRLPLSRIEKVYLNPDDPEQVWFIKERYHRETVSNPQGEDVEKWYRVDLADEPRATRMRTINEGGDHRVNIDRSWIAVVDSVNGQVGHTFGTPDLLTSLPWLERYNEYLHTQLDFQKALSAIAVHIKSRTTIAQKQTQAALKGGGNAGMASTGDDTEIVAQRGGSDVSFDNGRAIAAMAATGAEVSVIHALSDPGAAGSSYGSAQNLDSPTQKMIQTRRESLTMLLKRVFTLLGAPKAVIKWPRIEDEATYRLVQAVGLLWQSGLFTPEIMREKFGELLDLSQILGPADVLIPNTLSTLEAQSKVKQDETAAAAEAAAEFAVNSQGDDAQGLGKMDDQSNGNRPPRDDEA